MKKLFLVLFLCTLASNAFAKVEGWRCDLVESILIDELSKSAEKVIKADAP